MVAGPTTKQPSEGDGSDVQRRKVYQTRAQRLLTAADNVRYYFLPRVLEAVTSVSWIIAVVGGG